METIRKGYKQIDIGVIPEDWDDKKMHEIGDTYTGLTGKNATDFKCGDARYIPFLNILTNPKIDIRFLESVSVKPTEIQNRVKKGDLFFNTSSETPEEVGLCSVLQHDIPNLYLNSFCFGFRLFNQKEVDGLFLSYFFRSKQGRYLMTQLAQGATRYNLAKTNFMQAIIALPPPAEQRAIADVLSDIDLLIEVLDKKIAKKRAIKDGAMQQLLSPKTNWKTCKLGEICEITMGQSPSSDSYNEDGCGILLVQGNADISNRRINKRIWTTQPSKYSGENAIIMTVRAPVGHIAMSLENCCLGRGVCALNNGEINKWFLYYLLIFNEYKWSILEQGSTFTSANSKQIYDFEISYPDNPIEEIKTATILLDMDAEIELLEQQRSKYTALKQGAMQQLLTGQIRLR